MNREQLVQRIAEIQTAVDQSVANHHALVGRLNEAKYMLELMDAPMPAEMDASMPECEPLEDAEVVVEDVAE